MKRTAVLIGIAGLVGAGIAGRAAAETAAALSATQPGTGYEVRELMPFVNTAAGGKCTKVAASLPFGSIMVSPRIPNPGGRNGSVAYTCVNTGSSYKYGILSVSAGFPTGKPGAAGTDNEWKLTPAFSSGVSPEGVKAEVTAATRCAIFRVFFPAAPSAPEGGWIVLDPMTTEKFNAVEFDSARRLVTGRLEYSGGWYYSKGIRIWYAAQPSEAPVRTETSGGKMKLFFKTDPSRPILFKVAISFKGPENAERNLQEIEGVDFEAQAKRSSEIWNRALSVVLVDDPNLTDAGMRTLYTAVYRTLLGPKDRTGDCPWDYDGPYYDDHLCIWDTFRTELPWLTLARRSVSRDIVRSFAGVFRKYGYVNDAFLGGKGDMIQGGDNVDVAIADALVKKVPGLDARELYAVMRAHAVETGRTPEYLANDQGWVPYGTLERLAKGGAGKTMEFAYNDFCAAQVAGLLGLEDDRRRFGARSERWSELWNSETASRGFTGFIQSRDKNGKWVPSNPFRPRIEPFCPHFYECDSWTYSLFVPHQVARLIEMCGGPEVFAKRLASYGDVNGMANEPHFLLPYLFVYASRPDLTPVYTRKIWSRFNQGKTPGDEDSGAMSSWFLFATMGFFPNAGQDVYLVNGPRYRKLIVQMEDGRKLTVEAENAGPRNIYVSAMKINGTPWNQAWFTHDRIADGGRLVFTMSDQPTDWARSAPVPPSHRFTPAYHVSTNPPPAAKDEGGEAKAAAVTVDLRKPAHTMAGGMGASWHAIRAVLPGKRGSAYGANPPLGNAKEWEQIGNHARWLGLDWMRIEFDQRMYQPERNTFDWDNEEMLTLYRILDWCETNRVDVLLTQMWTDVAWNKLPKRDALTSAPKSVEDFAEGISTLAGHLLNTKKYTCIRWLCIANEPESNWWLGGCSILDGIKATRKALDAKGITLPLAGPDSVNGVPYKGLPPDGEFDTYVGAYCTHTYQVAGKARRDLLAVWSQFAHARKKPFFLSEFGVNPPWGDRPKSYEAVIMAAETVLDGLSVGVDAFNRWSFLNRGDIDGQWQLVRTWDMGKKEYLAEVVPEPVPYMGYAMLTRFTAKHSAILDCRVTTDVRQPGIRAAALRSPAGNVTILLLNSGSADCAVALVLEGLETPLKLFPYVLSESALAVPGFTLEAGSTVALTAQSPLARLTVPARGLMTLTTFALRAADPGIMADDVRKP